MSATRERVLAALEGLEAGELAVRDGMPCVELQRERLREGLARLRDRAGFEQHTIVTAVDHFPREPRYELVHQLLSYRHNDRVRVKLRLPSDDAWAPTCTDLWPGAAFWERECFDMFGVRFEGLADHRRLMMPEGYDHFPLRKDFPHRGIEPDRLYRLWDRKRREGWKEEAR